MEGEGNGEEKKLSVSVEKIKLIDIFTENDDFLVASPLCGSPQDSFSGFGNSSPKLEILQYKDDNQMHSDFVKISRSSFHRKSIAWDSAFFDSPGVLDSDELSCINNGLQKIEARLLSPFAKQHRSRKTPNVANRGLEKAGLLKGGDGLQNMPSMKKVYRSVRNKSSGTRRHERLSSLEPPKTSGRNIRTASRDRELSLKSYNVKMENSSTKITGSGQVLFASHESSSSSFKFSSIFPSISPNLLKRKTDHRIRASFSTSNVERHAERNNKVAENNNVTTSLSTGQWSSYDSVVSSECKNKQRSRGSFDHNDENEALNMQQSPSLNSPKRSQVCCMGLRPSELRPPSPQIGFFDENTSPRYHHDITRSRKMRQKVSSEGSSYSNTRSTYSNSGLSADSIRHASACKKLESPYSKSAKNIKRPKTSNHMDSFLVTNKKANDGENEKRSHSCSRAQLGYDLSRYFAAIDLNREKTKQLRKRAPLAEFLQLG
ncbi:hypothetical protein OROGR_002284 [Orobanche gracilis]